MKNNQLEQLYNDLASTTLPIEELAKKYGVSAATIHNIDKGKTHHNSALSYPIRKEPARATINPNKIAFLQLYKNTYKPSVMAAILEINYETACKYYAAEPQSLTYTHDPTIEKRKYVVDYVSFGVKWKRLRNVVFNLSDFCIIIGALLTALGAGR